MSSNDKNKKFTDNLSEAVKEYGHIYALVIIAFIALWSRLRGQENLTTESGAIALLGNDSWYHYRAVRYTIDNFPFTIGVDPKSGYPIGADVGTFGTLYDQIIATVALILGLGNPSAELIREIMIYSSPIFFIGIIISVYYLTKYVSNSKWVGVASAAIVTFIPGVLYQRTVVGFAQHHVLEVLFLLIAVFFTMKALDTAEKENITWELIQLREFDNLKPWLKSVAIASVAILVYYLTWPPAMLYFGLLAASAGLYALITYDSETPTEPALLTFVTLLISSLIFVLIQNPTMEPSVSSPSIIHIGVVSASLIGTVIVFAYNRYAQEHNWSASKFQGISIGTGLIALIGIALIQPSVFIDIFDNIMRLLGFPFGIGGEDIQTIAEEQSTTFVELSFGQYGFLLGVAVFGIAMMILGIDNPSKNDKEYASRLFLAIVGIFFVIISIRTVRFNYYLAPLVAIFSMITISYIVKQVDIPTSKDEFEGYQVIALLLLITLVIPILFFPLSGTVFAGAPPVSTGDYQEWEEPLMWMSEETESDNIPNDISVSEQPYEYDEDSYGVLSWWDYGHWITVTGDRAPVSNPFQQHAEESSEFLLSDNSDDAESVITDMDEDAEARYIAIDWQMISPFSKLTAIPEFNEDVSSEDLIEPYYVSSGNSQDVAFFERNQRYYESMMVRLYLGHGGQMDPGPYTIDYSQTSVGGEQQNQQQGEQPEQDIQSEQSIRTIVPQQNPVKVHNSTEEARQYAEDNEEVSFGGIGANPKESVEALENYRLVKSSPNSAFQNPAVGAEIGQVLESSDTDIELTEFDSNPSSVKIFEKVEGAEITGDGADAGETISITVSMMDSDTGLQFEYKQETQADDNGEFSATVPYSTTGYDDVDYPPEVQGASEYIIEGTDSEKSQSTEVTESDVIDSDSEPITVTLEESDSELDEEDIDLEDAIDIE